MRLERQWDNKAELSFGDLSGTHVLTAEQIAKLAIWIEELWPEEVAQARLPKPNPMLRED
jgi:hypothetical protein